MYFKDNQSAFTYACKFIDNSMQKDTILPAIVKETSNVSGGLQNLKLLLASNDGGVSVIAKTINNKVIRINEGDFVAFQVLEYHPESPIAVDLIGFVVSKLQAIYDVEEGGWHHDIGDRELHNSYTISCISLSIQHS
ncbi:MAG: hypothetical protein MAG551_00539 [Candidatus Scalindua arabica]|uniref:Uncharacterized protein n=1 Tax=Candidatus Scalindua arabica TaxID=1127984 RepID=A0A941W073_9BACT|nr:hypothetical protein [Candidatus Scalindua arabica]